MVDVVVSDIELPNELVNVYVKVPDGVPLFNTIFTEPLLLLQVEFVVFTEITENEFGVIILVEFVKLQRPASCTKTLKLPEHKPVNVCDCENVIIVWPLLPE